MLQKMVDIIFKKLFRGCKIGQMYHEQKIHHCRQFLGIEVGQPFHDSFLCSNSMFVSPETSEVHVKINFTSQTRSSFARGSKLLDSLTGFLRPFWDLYYWGISWQHYVLLHNHNISVPLFLRETTLPLIMFSLCVLKNTLRKNSDCIISKHIMTIRCL